MATQYDGTQAYGNLAGSRQREMYAKLRQHTVIWAAIEELADWVYGDTDPASCQAARQLVYRMRRLGVPIESRDVPSGTPTAYRLRRET